MKLRFVHIPALLLLAACAQQPQAPATPPDTRQADEMAIRSAITDWAGAAEKKDAETFVSFYAEDATVILEGAPDVTGKAAIRETIAGMMQDPSFRLSFTPTAIDVARSGDLALEDGTYALTMTDPATKKATSQNGHYVVIWKKQADGAWKVIRDVPVSDPAAPPAPTPTR